MKSNKLRVFKMKDYKDEFIEWCCGLNKVKSPNWEAKKYMIIKDKQSINWGQAFPGNMSDVNDILAVIKEKNMKVLQYIHKYTNVNGFKSYEFHVEKEVKPEFLINEYKKYLKKF